MRDLSKFKKYYLTFAIYLKSLKKLNKTFLALILQVLLTWEARANDELNKNLSN